MYGSAEALLNKFCELSAAAGEFGLPADLRRNSIDASSHASDARECFGCNDRRAPKCEHPPRLSAAILKKQTQSLYRHAAMHPNLCASNNIFIQPLGPVGGVNGAR